MKGNDDSVPLYQQVKQHIVDGIEAGEYRPGGRVPSEYELVDRLGISRMTVNRGIRELATEGWLMRVPGLGTFVAEPASQSPLMEIRPIADEIAERGGTHTAVLVDAVADVTDADSAYAMGLRLGDPVFRVTLVHHENGQPIQLEDRLVNPTLAPAFLDQDFTAITPSEYLLRHVPYSEIEHIIESRLPTDSEGALLKIDANEPCLILNRRTWSGTNVVTSVRLVHIGSNYRLGSRFTPVNRASPQVA